MDTRNRSDRFELQRYKLVVMAADVDGTVLACLPPLLPFPPLCGMISAMTPHSFPLSPTYAIL